MKTLGMTVNQGRERNLPEANHLSSESYDPTILYGYHNLTSMKGRVTQFLRSAVSVAKQLLSP